MTATPVLRIVQFRPLGVEIDDTIRRRLVPALRAQDGCIEAIAGRQGPEELGQRIVVSVWSVDDASVEPTAARQLDDLAISLGAADLRTEWLGVGVRSREPGSGGARLLRVFRGQVRPGELDRYVTEVEAGARADADAGFGPLSLVLGVDQGREDRFVTVSTWPDWPTIEAATGGDVRRPIATRHPERLVTADVTHFEVVDV